MAKTIDVAPNWYERYNAKRIITVRIRAPDEPGTFAGFLQTIGEVGAQIGDVKTIGLSGEFKIREVQMFLVDEDHQEAVLDAIRAHAVIELQEVRDEVLEIHRHGTIETQARVPLNSLMDLRMVYTPGVASVCQTIAAEPDKAWDYTALGRKIAIVTNGTAVLGLGDIGTLASLPVMEGKAAILAKFVGVSAEPLLIDSKDPQEIVDIVAKCSAGYGAIQLEDIAAPECFEIEEKLKKRLNKPVFHDDQHGTATVCVAGLINALKRTNRKPGEVRAAILGAGAAGSAIAKFLLRFGVNDVVVCDSRGAIFRGRQVNMNPFKESLAAETNRENVEGSIADVMKGRNLFVGVARANAVSKDMVASMEKDPIVFALANPVSEISVQDALEAGAKVALDGRGMNNALAYPGLFRGALDARATAITPQMMLATSHALAAAAVRDELLPDMLDPRVHTKVIEAVIRAARDG